MKNKNIQGGEFHTSTFARINPDKQQRILDVAIQEFAAKGYNAASINVIARTAGISIGAMYSYFASKEDLYMSILDRGQALLKQALQEVENLPGDFFAKMEMMIGISQRYALEQHQLNQIYIEVATEGLSHLARRISFTMESVTAAMYHRLIEQAKADGLVERSLDTRMTSFFLDNLVMLVQFSYASDYYRERLKIYAGEENFTHPERLRDGLMKFLRGALEPKQPNQA